MELREQILTDFESGSVKLSSILMKIIRCAHEMNHPVLEYIAKLDSLTVTEANGLSERKTSRLKSEVLKKLTILGMDSEEISNVMSNVMEDYIERRSLSKEGVSTLSVGQLENEIIRLETLLDKNVIPDGMASLDIFVKLNEKKKIDNILVEQLTLYLDIVSKIRDYYYQFVINLKMSEGEKVKQMREEIANKVFIIHGKSESKWRELKGILSDKFNLESVILSEKAQGSMTIIEKFEKNAKECTVALAIFTADDIVQEGEVVYVQTRPNVLFELGWFCSYLGRERVLILLEENEQHRILSDLDGVMQLRFKSNIEELYMKLDDEFKLMGIIPEK